MLLPSIVLFVLVRLIPLVSTFVISFFRWSVIERPIFNGFENFTKLMNDKVFWVALINTIEYAVYVVPISIVLGLLLALLLNKKIRGMSFFRIVYFFPYVTSLVFVGLIWKYLFDERGLINTIMQLFGIPSVSWLNSPDIVLFSIAIVGIWTVIPFNMIVLLASIQSIPNEYKESAIIDGANSWQVVWKILVPLLNPTIFFISFVGITRTFQVFDLTYVMTQGGPINSSLTLVHYMYNYGFKYLEMGYASAVSVVLFILIFISTLLQKKVFKQ
jgi:ABC-type sugar transport system permease subunit